MRLWSAGTAHQIVEPKMGRLTSVPIPAGERSGYIAYLTPESLDRFGSDVEGYEAALFSYAPAEAPSGPAILAPPHLEYLGDDDVVHMYPNGTVQVLYRRSSDFNVILATERCNSLCLMCSQPPRDVDDSYRVKDILRLLDLISLDAREICISGGEPTLLDQGLLAIVEKAERVLPGTALHILSNGRRFRDSAYALAFSEIRHHDLMLGVPLYSDIDWRHDHVVQARGAYDETIEGLYNLARCGVRIELRVVLHAQTVARLPELAQFIGRNLPFVEQVALMGLEMTGFTPRNLDVLWIDPHDYARELEAAVRSLALLGTRVWIYNHQLCTIPKSLWPFAVKSISDWKNVYLPECDGCAVRYRCGGFFQSATKRHSAHIRAVAPLRA
jgi:His-Xaa-Ser system radical SAM maturase HxsC